MCKVILLELVFMKINLVVNCSNMNPGNIHFQLFKCICANEHAVIITLISALLSGPPS